MYPGLLGGGVERRELIQERDHGTVLVGITRVDVALQGVLQPGRGDLVASEEPIVEIGAVRPNVAFVSVVDIDSRTL